MKNLDPTKKANSTLTNGNDSNDEDDTLEEESDEEDEVGWITPSNLEEVKKMNLNELEEDISNLSVKVACMTSDFAMQVSKKMVAKHIKWSLL